MCCCEISPPPRLYIFNSRCAQYFEPVKYLCRAQYFPVKKKNVNTGFFFNFFTILCFTHALSYRNPYVNVPAIDLTERFLAGCFSFRMSVSTIVPRSHRVLLSFVNNILLDLRYSALLLLFVRFFDDVTVTFAVSVSITVPNNNYYI